MVDLDTAEKTDYNLYFVAYWFILMRYECSRNGIFTAQAEQGDINGTHNSSKYGIELCNWVTAAHFYYY